VLIVKAILYITPIPEYYRVVVYVYSNEGKLVESNIYDKVKHITIEECTVRLSSQIVYDEIALIVDAENISVNLKSESILVIKGSKKG
jgi:hypothetical protein